MRSSKTRWCLTCSTCRQVVQPVVAESPPHSPSKQCKLATKLLLIFCVLIVILSSGRNKAHSAVVYQVRFIGQKSGRLDYAIEGETVELSCHYLMKDEAEDVKQLVWSKDGKNFLRWRKNKPGLEVLSYTFKGHVAPQSTYSHISLQNVTLDMHGRYRCLVKTDLGSYEAEENFVVISQSRCRLNDWRVVSQPSECRERIRFDCRNMFPKPVPSCGLWNSKLEKFIKSVVVDISEEPQKQTYRVRYAEKFNLPNGSNSSLASAASDLLQYNGNLMFRCDISVPETSWRLSFMYRMFDFNDGCHQDPLEAVERMRANYSLYVTSRMQEAGYLLGGQLSDFEMITSSNLKYELLGPTLNRSAELNCWQRPKLGTLAKLSCATKSSQVKFTGANLLQCQSSGWVPVLESQLPVQTAVTTTKRPSRVRLPPRPSRRAPVASGAAQEEESATEGTTYLTDGDSNDLEEVTTTETSSTGAPPTTEFETIPPEGAREDTEHQPATQLSPNQLAALLPTCVSTRRHHHQTPVTINRLPLLDGETLHSLDSAGKKQSAANNRDTKQRGGSIFNFSSSGSQSIKAPIPPLVFLSSLLTLAVALINLQGHHRRLFSSEGFSAC